MGQLCQNCDNLAAENSNSIFSEGWDEENLILNLQDVKTLYPLSNLIDSSKDLMDVNINNSFKSYSQFFGKQQPPSDSETDWKDSSFPAEDRSLFHININDGTVTKEELDSMADIVWDTPDNIFRTQDYSWYNVISIDDVKQGEWGNCYFWSVLAELAKSKEIYDKLFITKKKPENGCYKVRLLIRGIPKIVCIDNYFPCRERNGRKQFVFCESGFRELWVQVLEKVWAKVNTSYASTIAGLPTEVFECWTEAPCVNYIHQKYHKDQFWAILNQAKIKKAYIATSSGNYPKAEELGIVPGHAYSLTNWYEFDINNGGKLRLIQLRNPWGSFEWKGKFSDNSNEWNIIPDLKSKVGLVNRDDGFFFMDFDDFLKYYNYTFVLNYHQNWSYNFKKLEQESCNHITCAKLIISKDTPITVGLRPKQWRFYDKVSNYKLQVGSIIIAKYNPETRSYSFIGSEFQKDETLYAETQKILTTGEYHIFLNVFWPYSTVNNYTLTTYSEHPVEIAELTKAEIPRDYLYQILRDFLDRFPKEKVGKDIEIVKNIADNDIGFYMIHLRNTGNNAYRYFFSANTKNTISLNEDCVNKRAEGNSWFIDEFKGVLKAGDSKLFAWRLIENPWDCGIRISNIKADLLKDIEEETMEKDYQFDWYSMHVNLKKKVIGKYWEYSTVDLNNSEFLLVFRNNHNWPYRVKCEFEAQNWTQMNSQSPIFDILGKKIVYFVFKRNGQEILDELKVRLSYRQFKAKA